MLLLNKILFPHALDGIILVVLFVLAKHNLAKGSSSQNLQQFKLFKAINAFFVGFILENKFTFGLGLLILFNGL